MAIIKLISNTLFMWISRKGTKRYLFGPLNEISMFESYRLYKISLYLRIKSIYKKRNDHDFLVVIAISKDKVNNF